MEMKQKIVQTTVQNNKNCQPMTNTQRLNVKLKCFKLLLYKA